MKLIVEENFLFQWQNTIHLCGCLLPLNYFHSFVSWTSHLVLIFPKFSHPSHLALLRTKTALFLTSILQVEAGWLDLIQRIYHHNSWATQETYQNLVLWVPGHNPDYETATTIFTPPSKDTLSPTHRNLLCPLDSKLGFIVGSNINVYFPFVSVEITTLNAPLLILYNLVPTPLYTAASWNETQWFN